MAWPRKKKGQADVGLKYGFRSGLEDAIANQLKHTGTAFSFEELVVPFLQPAKPRKYTPDFLLLSNGIIVETKGRFMTEDRQKHLLVKDQYPGLDIRFVFSNPNTRISKQSKTTYSAWCEAKGFLYAARTIPLSWLEEPPNECSLAIVASLKG